MSKNLENLSERELLIEIAKGQRKEARSGRISAIAIIALCLAVVIALGTVIPTLATTLGKVYDTLDQAEKAAVSAQQSLKEVDELVGNFNDVVVDNSDSMNKAISRVSEIDVDSLNRSIEELASILDPLARLFGRG